jgi:hypothetical protein
MPWTDDKDIAAMKDVWLREIFRPATSLDGRDDRTDPAAIAGLRDLEHPGMAGRKIGATHQSPAPLIARARRKRRSIT